MKFVHASVAYDHSISREKKLPVKWYFLNINLNGQTFAERKNPDFFSVKFQHTLYLRSSPRAKSTFNQVSGAKRFEGVFILPLMLDTERHKDRGNSGCDRNVEYRWRL